MIAMLCTVCHSVMKQYGDLWICSECEKTREEVENGKSIDIGRSSVGGDSES